MNYTSLAPEVETPHDDISSKIHWLRQITERMGADKVAKLYPHWLAPDRIQHARTILGDAWVEKHYPGLMPKVVAEVKAPTFSELFDDRATAELRRIQARAVIQARAAKAPAVVKLAVPVAVEAPEPTAPAVAEVEAPKVSITTDQLLPDIAPAFRGFDALPAPNSGRAFTAVDDENLIQQRIADLEWLHRRGHRVEIDSHEAAGGRARHLLTSEEFDRDLAREVAACRLLSGDGFVAALYLPEWLEVEMAQLCTKSMKMKRLRARRNRPKVEAKLRAGVAPKHRNHVARWLDVHHCMALVGDSPSAIARLYIAMTGVKMSKSTACEARNEVRKRVA